MTTELRRLGMNEIVPCPSPSARRRHAAHGELCPVCDPLIERPGICPVCGDRIPVLGDRYTVHEIDMGERCPGSQAPARPISPLAARLRDRRKALGWTQAELAARAGLKKNVVASFEAGVSPLLTANRDALVEALGYQQTLTPRGAA